MAVATLPPEAKIVAQKCSYVALAIVLCSRYILKGVPWQSLLDGLKSATGFEGHPNEPVLKAIDITLRALDADFPGSRKRYQQLAVFPEEVVIPSATLMTLWVNDQFSEFEAQRLINELSGRALLTVHAYGETRFFQLHDIMHDYLRLVFPNQQSAHRELVDAYRNRCPGGWQNGPNDGYFFQHLVYHLIEASYIEDLMTLLTGSTAWMDSKVTIFGSNMSYFLDLEFSHNIRRNASAAARFASILHGESSGYRPREFRLR